LEIRNTLFQMNRKIIITVFSALMMSSCISCPTPSEMKKIADSRPATFMILTKRLAAVSSDERDQMKKFYPNIEVAKKHLTFNYEYTQELVKREKDKIVWYNYYPGIEKKAATSTNRRGISYEGQIFGGGYFNNYDFYMDKDLNILGHVKSR